LLRRLGFLYNPNPMKTRRWCRIDAAGCARCGGREFVQSAVINDALAATWELSARERRLFDAREGHFCRQCGMSRRVRMLTWTLTRSFSSLNSKAVLHFNQINQLHPVLSGAEQLVETMYRPGMQPGESVDGLVHQDMTCLTFPDSSFDLVLHSDTIEHILDYEKALSEAERVLKPGGIQIYTIPLLHKRQTRQRIGMDVCGQRTNLLPPSGHGSEGEFPVVWEFGGDFLLRRRRQITTIQYDNYWTNPTVFTVLEQKPI